MHDATEGGVLGGLFEIANASNTGMLIDERKFIYPEEVRLVMNSLGIDPVEAISEGTLIITALPDKADEIVEKLIKEGILSSVIGEIIPKGEGRTIIRLNEKKGTFKNSRAGSLLACFL